MAAVVEAGAETLAVPRDTLMIGCFLGDPDATLRRAVDLFGVLTLIGSPTACGER